MNPTLHVVRIEATKAFAAAAEPRLAEAGIDLISWTAEDTDEAVLEVYCDSATDAGLVAERVRELLADPAGDPPCVIGVRELPPRDWQEAWKEFFHTERVSDRIVVKPSWEAFDAEGDDCVIEIDPGMSFGTGQHATTRACLRFLDALCRERPGASFLDLGCGSGILSIAAAKLDCRRVTAIDYDALAVDTAQANTAHNGVADRVQWAVADVAALETVAPHDIVAANILANVLESCAPQISATVARPDGCLILAGILTTQYARVRRLYEEHGFAELSAATEAEWTSGCFRRAP